MRLRLFTTVRVYFDRSAIIFIYLYSYLLVIFYGCNVPSEESWWIFGLISNAQMYICFREYVRAERKIQIAVRNWTRNLFAQGPGGGGKFNCRETKQKFSFPPQRINIMYTPVSDPRTRNPWQRTSPIRRLIFSSLLSFYFPRRMKKKKKKLCARVMTLQ